MEDLDYEFMLEDRIAKIQAINEQYKTKRQPTLVFCVLL